MSLITNVIGNIDKGIEGGNRGLSIGHSQLSYVMPNLQPSTMYLLGGESGSGKSAFAYETFIYNPYEDWYGNLRNDPDYKLKIFVWSLEMDKHIVVTKAVCRKIFLDYGRIVDVNFVLSRGKNRVSSDIYEIVKSYISYYEEFEDRVMFLEPENPTGIYHKLQKYMRDNGTEVTHPMTIKHKDGTEEEIVKFDRYTPDKKNTHVIVLVDHLALLKSERSMSKKDKIDKFIEYAIFLRDRYGVTFVLVQQLNRALSSVDRMKLPHELDVQISDFKETSDTTDAANFILGMFSPNRYPAIKSYRGYHITDGEGFIGLKDRFRSLKILKSRDGNADIGVGMSFVGEVGHFEELPFATNMTREMYQRISEYQKEKNYV